MTDLDEELKRVRLQREKLALQEDERRAARRQQTSNMAHTVASTVASTTRDVADKTLRVGAALAWSFVFGMAVALALLLLAAVGDLAGVGQGFAYRVSFYSGRYLGICALVVVGAGVWCYFRFFRHRV